MSHHTWTCEGNIGHSKNNRCLTCVIPPTTVCNMVNPASIFSHHKLITLARKVVKAGWPVLLPTVQATDNPPLPFDLHAWREREGKVKEALTWYVVCKATPNHSARAWSQAYIAFCTHCKNFAVQSDCRNTQLQHTDIQ